MLDTALKPYPCCHMNHAFIDCIAALQARHAIASAAVERVECFIAAREVPIVCEPQATKWTPQNDYDAKFSLPYTVASMLLRGHVDIDDFTDAAIRDPAVLALARRVVYREDPTSDYPRCFPGWLRIHLRDGRVLEHHEPINRGSAERPLTEAEVQDKFRRNAARAILPQQAEAAIAAVAALERHADLSGLTSTLRPG
jgi:2-methylcitrate dehydratase PrpD